MLQWITFLRINTIYSQKLLIQQSHCMCPQKSNIYHAENRQSKSHNWLCALQKPKENS